MSIFEFDYFFQLVPKICRYMAITLRLALFSMILGLILGIILAVIKYYKVKYVYGISKIYVSFFRSTPFIAQLFLFYYGMAQFIPFIKDMKPELAIIIALGLNSSAYMAETIRGAIMSIDRGQFEACISIGMTGIQAMVRIIVPQAIRIAIPSLSNNFIDLIKGTAIGFTIGVMEMMGKAQLETANSYRFLEAYVATIFIYWVIVAFFGVFQKKLEMKMSKCY